MAGAFDVAHLFFSRLPGDAVGFLDRADELVPDHVRIVVRKPASARFGLALKHVPVAFELLPVDGTLLDALWAAAHAPEDKA